MFEDRYLDALRARIDLERFILDEIVLVQKLIDDEHEKLKLENEARESRRKNCPERKRQEICCR